MFGGKALQQEIFSVGGAGRQASRPEAAGLPSRGMVVPYAPGGTTDVVARIFAEKLQLILKQPFVVDSKPGANGMLGPDERGRKKIDRHTTGTPTCAPC